MYTHRLISAWFILWIVFSGLEAQNFENGFDFNLPYDDTASVDFFPGFHSGPIMESDTVSTDGAGNFIVHGKPYRFFGGNLTTRGAFPAKEDAPLIAGRMRKYGINLIRFHHIDNPWSDGSLFHSVNGTREFNLDRLDRLDYLIYQLKQHGIYVNMNLHVSRTFEKRDGVIHADSLSDYGKGVTQFDPHMVKLQKEYADMLLDHVNPYTGATLADDPILAMVEIINENSLFRMWYSDALKPISEGGKLPDYYNDQLDSLWIDFLEDKYETTANLEEAWNINRFNSDTILFDGFENGLGGSWVLEINQTAAGTATITDQAATGSSAAQVHVTSSGTEDWHIQFKMVGESVKKDSIYEVVVKAKADEPVEIGLTFMRDDSPYTWYNGTGLDLDTQWKEFRFSFKAPEDNEGHLRVSLGFNGNLGNFYFDDFLLRSEGNDGLLPEESLEQKNVSRLQRDNMFAFTEERLMDQSEFYIDIQAGFLKEMGSYLSDSLGVRAPMTGTNWFTGPEDVYVQNTLDYVDNHAYWDHPQFPGEPWSSTDWIINNAPMLTSPDGTIDNLFPGVALKNKPYTVSEYNHAFPNQYQSELLPIITSYLSFNDADGLMIFTYSGEWNWDLNKVEGFFDIHRNSNLMGSFPLYSYAFRNYLIDAATEKVILEYSKEDIFRMPLSIEEWWTDHFPYDPRIGYTHRVEMSVDHPEDFDYGALPPVTPGPYSLNEGQIYWDKAGILIIDTKKFASITGQLDTYPVKETEMLQVVSGSDFGSVAWLSLVDSTLEESSKSVLAISSKMGNTGMIWDGTTTVHNNWGSEPALVSPLSLELKLKTDQPHMRITPMDQEGRLRASDSDTVVTNAEGFAVIALDQDEDQTLWYAVEAMNIPGYGDPGTGSAALEPVEYLRCYPNPATKAIHFEMAEPGNGPEILKILDLNGKQVFNGAILDKLTVDTSLLSPGIYIYQVTGTELQHGRFALVRP